jgi:hypothetical protein
LRFNLACFISSTRDDIACFDCVFVAHGGATDMRGKKLPYIDQLTSATEQVNLGWGVNPTQSA